MSALADRLARAGDDLTAASIAWAPQPEQPTPLLLRARDYALLADLEEHRFLTTSMIHALHATGPAVYPLQRRIRDLQHAGLIARFRPRMRPGSREWIAMLTNKGWEHLADTGRARHPGGLATPKVTDLAYVSHHVQLNGLICRIAQQAAGTDHLAGTRPFTWHGDQNGRTALVELGEPRSRRPADWTLQRGRSTPGRIEPDGALTGHMADGAQTWVLLEYDRTQRPGRLKPKLRRYDWLLADAWRSTPLGDCRDEPAVVFIAQTDTELPGILQAADQTLTASIGPQRADPADRTYPGRDQIGFTTRQRLDAGNWTMQQVSRYPRPKGAPPHTSRTIELDLTKLFVAPATTTSGS